MRKKLMILLFLVLVSFSYGKKEKFKYRSRREKEIFLIEVLDKCLDMDKVPEFEKDELFDEWQSILEDLTKKAYKDNEALEQLIEWRELHKKLSKKYKKVKIDIDDDDDDDDD